MKDEELSISFNAVASSLAKVGLQTPPLPTQERRPLHNEERKGKQRAASDRASGSVKQKLPVDASDRASGSVKQKLPLDEDPGRLKPPLDRSTLPARQKHLLNRTSAPVRQKEKSQKVPSGTKAVIKQKPASDESAPKEQRKAPSDKKAAPVMQKPPLEQQQMDPTANLVRTNSQDSIHKRQNVAEWLFKTQNYAKNGGTSANKVQWDEQSKKLPTKRIVYLSDSSLQFPETLVGAQAMVKVRLCNRDTIAHHFAVIKPSQPFSVIHVSFEIG